MSPPASKLKHKTSFTQPTNEESPIRLIACLKRIDDIRRFEETDDCFILGFDPNDSLIDGSAKPKPKPHHHDDDDICFVGEKGKVALRDYPHSRHLCLKFPFKSTPHESYCEMCYCYVCDCTAPCKSWNSHCNAENVGFWKELRRNMKQALKDLTQSQRI